MDETLPTPVTPPRAPESPDGSDQKKWRILLLIGLTAAGSALLLLWLLPRSPSPTPVPANGSPTATATASAKATPTATPTPTPTPTPTLSPTPTAVADRIIVTSVSINSAYVTSCGDFQTYLPTGNTVCYWDFTSPGGGGWYAFAGSTTGPLAALAGAPAGAVVTWTVSGTTYTRTLSGSGNTIAFNPSPSPGAYGGHGIPPGQHVFLEVRDATQETEYDGAP